MKDGVTKAARVSTWITDRPGRFVRETSHASGTPRNVERIATAVASRRELRTGCSSDVEVKICR
jgi:hypothetical protein